MHPKYISIHSGICYEVQEEDVCNLDNGQIPLTEFPEPSCDHCYGKGHTNKDAKTGVYVLCRCLLKKTKIDLTKYFIDDVKLHTVK